MFGEMSTVSDDSSRKLRILLVFQWKFLKLNFKNLVECHGSVLYDIQQKTEKKGGWIAAGFFEACCFLFRLVLF